LLNPTPPSPAPPHATRPISTPPQVRLLNYKRSGAPFWNMFTLAPMKDSDGTVRFLIGVQVGVGGWVGRGRGASLGTPCYAACGAAFAAAHSGWPTAC
jgi:hypothetical protein